jgi:predicted metalloendopeptidase
VFPAGVLQREILSPERPKYLNYGTVGFIVGYIFAQAFEVFSDENFIRFF